MSEKRGLGKGLSALIPSLPEEARTIQPMMSGRAVVQVEISKIIPNPRQPRKVFDDEKLNELAESIKEQGITSPVLVRKRGDVFEIIAGERRTRAAKKAGLEFVPVIIKEYTDEQSLEIAIVENLQREDLNPIEESHAYKALSVEFKLTHEQIAKKVGKNRATVTNSMRLLELPEEIVSMISAGQISPGHARPLIGLEDNELQISIAQEIVKNNLSVRDVEDLLTTLTQGGKAEKTKKTQPKSLDVILKDVQERLTDRLGTKVDLKGSSQKGQIVIHYFSQEDLERIIEQVNA